MDFFRILQLFCLIFLSTASQPYKDNVHDQYHIRTNAQEDWMGLASLEATIEEERELQEIGRRVKFEVLTRVRESWSAVNSTYSEVVKFNENKEQLVSRLTELTRLYGEQFKLFKVAIKNAKDQKNLCDESIRRILRDCQNCIGHKCSDFYQAACTDGTLSLDDIIASLARYFIILGDQFLKENVGDIILELSDGFESLMEDFLEDVINPIQEEQEKLIESLELLIKALESSLEDLEEWLHSISIKIPDLFADLTLGVFSGTTNYATDMASSFKNAGDDMSEAVSSGIIVPSIGIVAKIDTEIDSINRVKENVQEKISAMSAVLSMGLGGFIRNRRSKVTDDNLRMRREVRREEQVVEVSYRELQNIISSTMEADCNMLSKNLTSCVYFARNCDQCKQLKIDQACPAFNAALGPYASNETAIKNIILETDEIEYHIRHIAKNAADLVDKIIDKYGWLAALGTLPNHPDYHDVKVLRASWNPMLFDLNNPQNYDDVFVTVAIFGQHPVNMMITTPINALSVHGAEVIADQTLDWYRSTYDVQKAKMDLKNSLLPDVDELHI